MADEPEVRRENRPRALGVAAVVFLKGHAVNQPEPFQDHQRRRHGDDQPAGWLEKSGAVHAEIRLRVLGKMFQHGKHGDDIKRFAADGDGLGKTAGLAEVNQCDVTADGRDQRPQAEFRLAKAMPRQLDGR